MTLPFDAYLRKLRETPLEEHTEHTGRSALEELLNHFADKAMAPGMGVQHEPKRESGVGAPDFKVKLKGMILGYVEVKELGANLDKVLKSEQIKKYRTLSDNIVVTDYLQFIRIDSAGKILDRQSLAFASDLESRTIRVNPDKAEAVAKLLSAFFSSPPQGLARAQQLALALATRSKLLRDYLTDELTRQSKAKTEGRLHALYHVFRDQVFHELTTKEFADAFAQMLAYGLFLAKLNAGDDDVITLDNVRKFIPGSFRLIRELVRFLEEMQEAEYDEAKWVVDEILSIVNGLAIADIRDDLSFRQRKAVGRKLRAGDEEEHRLFERDPFIYFYEDFLKAYDKDTRKARGVYYTPPPVVNFIVRAVDDILKDTFKIADGFADHNKVTVLDFAAGTGTFLLEVMQRIFDNIGGPESGKAGSVVREHMLKNLYGFEYLIAPYTIAHLKLSQYLKDKGHPLADDERLRVFLTNTLEPVEPQRDLNFPVLSDEVEAAQEVKEKPILVILGNPPYSGHSKNNGGWIKRAIDGYKYTVERVQTETDADGRPVFSDSNKPLGEKNPKWLNDDYVKFIRFAQMKMDAVEEGVVGIITNHSWLDNPTFRGMRQSLMRSFDQIYLVDLHGSTKPKEMVPDGEENGNVFDIQKGVAIALFVKKKGAERGIWHSDMWGNRLAKYRQCAVAEIASLDWCEPKPISPYFMLSPLDWTGWDEYGQWWQIADSLNAQEDQRQIFNAYGVGIATGNDRVAIQFDEQSINRAISQIRSGNEDQFKAAYNLKKFSAEWSWKNVRTDVLQENGQVRTILYRPFDHRLTYYSGRSNGFHSRPRTEIAENFQFENLALITSRLTKGENYAHANVTDKMSEVICLSPESSNNGFIFPIRTLNRVGVRQENFSPDFRTFLDSRYDHHYSPEEILVYIYAVLHAPTYRARYAEFLRIDFPRIPFAEKAEDFEALSALGWALVQAHLLRDLPRQELADYHGRGTNEVEHVRWSAEDARVSINKTQSFAPVPEAVWNFHIGGYQVIDKYLKSRKGRTLSLDEINHVGRVADALAFTIAQMERIDTAYAQAFPDRG